MRSSSVLVLAVLLILGTLAVQAAVFGVPYRGQEAGKGHVPVKGQGPVKGQEPVKGQDPIKTQDPQGFHSKPGTCPRILMRCAMMNPPNACTRDMDCQGAKKCCEGTCGLTCLTPR